jgi:hypothetical protein
MGGEIQKRDIRYFGFSRRTWRLKAGRFVLLCFLCSGACASALRFKRASAAEHLNHASTQTLFPL